MSVSTEGTTPLVTVLINNYNYARFLPDAVESALGQSYPRTEVVVVDDGSTDGSPALLERWAGRVRPVLKENGGQASALNAGWAVARGELVVFLDADDVLEPDTVERAVNAWGADVAMVRWPVAVSDAELEPMGRTIPADALAAGDLAPGILAGECFPATPTSGIALGRALADAVFPIPEEEWRISADAYLGLVTPLLGRVAALRLPGARYRLHGANRWAQASGLSVDWLHDRFRIDRQRQAAIVGFAPVPGDWLLRDAEHLQFRLASLRFQPELHPFPEDSRTFIGMLGARAALRTRAFRTAKRLGLAAWFLACALLPTRAALPLIEMGFNVRPRPWASARSRG